MTQESDDKACSSCNTDPTCDTKGQKCSPCIVSKIMVVALIGYALHQFFAS